ncbi:MAG TPA: cytidylate kinase family protein [Opitutaceae bacterium]|nr:cytidylate kinase family protein [Opitutaceae bacterium]
MSTFTTIERAQSYLTVHLTHAGPAGAAQSVGPFVTISRESGTSGSLLAQALALRLSREKDARAWAVYSGNLIEEMLRTNDLPPHLARFLPEDRIRQFDASVGEFVGLHPNLWDLVAKTNELIRHLARAGNAILLGRGANFATKDILHGVHVRLVASENHRAATTARWLSLSRSAAVSHNALRDAARRRYVRSNFEANIDDPDAYHVMLNVERLPLETMVDIVAHLVENEQSARSAASPGAITTATTLTSSGS